MGEVWRAEDTKLGRQVALKMLPDLFAQDPERLARFEREARVLASLSHPNIAGIHGLEEVDGKRFLVMELVEGQTLAERIQQGPMPIEEVVRIARQIAEAVESAHEKGVVHRDLKPANVNITPDGTVKVLDFGLAKALVGDPMSGDSISQDLSLSPTLTQAMTGMGVLLGTAGYMSPEQARGKPVDRRADIWAFGCIVYEMLTGQRLFTGETATDVIGAVVHKEPDLDELLVEGAGADPSPARALSAEGRQPPPAVDRRRADRPPGVVGESGGRSNCRGGRRSPGVAAVAAVGSRRRGHCCSCCCTGFGLFGVRGRPPPNRSAGR